MNIVVIEVFILLANVALLNSEALNPNAIFSEVARESNIMALHSHVGQPSVNVHLHLLLTKVNHFDLAFSWCCEIHHSSRHFIGAISDEHVVSQHRSIRGVPLEDECNRSCSLIYWWLIVFGACYNESGDRQIALHIFQTDEVLPTIFCDLF